MLSAMRDEMQRLPLSIIELVMLFISMLMILWVMSFIYAPLKMQRK